MLAIFLGAGFSILGGVPLAGQLFNEQPEVDVVSRRRLLERVLTNWDKWHSNMRGTPEQYLAELEKKGGQQWSEAVWYVSLVVALRMGHVRTVGGKLTIARHTLKLTSQIDAHEEFWTTIFRQTEDLGVLTTNYDILAERGMRPSPKPRVPRPGFHYGFGIEQLEGGGYPSYAHIQRIRTEGRVPLLKLHGSVSWSIRDGSITKYHDCRPAIRGDAMIVAPVTEKSVPTILSPIWEHASSILAASNKWLVVGYSFPVYDEAINRLLSSNANHSPDVHIFNPDRTLAERVRSLLPAATIYAHPGLPSGLTELPAILRTLA